MAPLLSLLADAAVTELAIVRPSEVFVRVRRSWERHDMPELTEEHLGNLAKVLAVFNGYDPATPILSVQFPDGERGQIVRPPACIDGTFSVNIRKHSMVVKTLEDLTTEGAFASWKDVSHASGVQSAQPDLPAEDQELLSLKNSGDIPGFLEAAIHHRRNILVSGATNAGKTTFARSLIERVPTATRVLTIEDTHELFLPNHPNRVHLLYAKNPGPGQISAAMCVESAMRMTPDRIFLAELRGDETWEYLQALNTGHPGSISTTHANSPWDAFMRLALLIKSSESGRGLDLPAIQAYLLSTIHIVLGFENFALKELYFDPAYARSRIGL